MSAKPFVTRALEIEATEGPRTEAPPVAAALVAARLALHGGDVSGAVEQLQAAVATHAKSAEG